MAGYVQELRALVGQQPLILVGVNVLMLDESGKLLLMERTDTRDWGLPGGFLELGETVEEAARREIREETGLDIEALQLFGVFSGPEYSYTYPNGDQVSNVTIVYLASSPQQPLRPDQVESKQLQFFELDRIPENIISSDRPIVEHYARWRQGARTEGVLISPWNRACPPSTHSDVL
jgi:ADP-ribose pyrophosphatase YjhB (NUDIX family)